MSQSKVVSVVPNKSNPRFPDSVSYSVTVEDEVKTVFSPNFCPEVGTTIEYELATSQNNGNTYFRIVLNEEQEQVATETKAAAVPSRSSSWQQRKMLPPLSPEEAVNKYAAIYQEYSAQGFFTNEEGFTAEDHRHILISMFIAATKPQDYYEKENENIE
jgi:hypothetical protein